ncbi:MAG: ATP-dependent Clp protease adaptor ClpS [Bacteroidales bacterium]|nr:ATP-dependent Clp protease adaptor ClpS [Bacteroidales bacterium]
MPKEQSNIKERSHIEFKEPQMYKVVMHNDDFTTMDFVVKVLKVVFHKDEATANQLMLTVHNSDKATVGIYTLDMAQSKCNWAMRMAREEGFPFKVTYEPD